MNTFSLFLSFAQAICSRYAQTHACYQLCKAHLMLIACDCGCLPGRFATFCLCTPHTSPLQLATEGTVKFTEPLVKNVMFQLLYGLAHMHKHGFMHRDLKPENLLTTGHPDTGDLCVKLADFGLARELRARPPYTEYVSTRWYRAPEVLLRFTSYSSPIDTFGAGMIMGELLAGQPLAPGTSEINQLYILCELLGTPSQSQWPEGYRQAEVCGFRWPSGSGGSAGGRSKLKLLCPNISTQAMDFLQQLLAFNPSKRPSPTAALQHAWFADVASTLGSLYADDTEAAESRGGAVTPGGGIGPSAATPDASTVAAASRAMGSTLRRPGGRGGLAAAGSATLSSSASSAALPGAGTASHKTPQRSPRGGAKQTQGGGPAGAGFSPGLHASATIGTLPIAKQGLGGSAALHHAWRHTSSVEAKTGSAASSPAGRSSLAAAGSRSVGPKAAAAAAGSAQGTPAKASGLDMAKLTNLATSASSAEFDAALESLLTEMQSPETGARSRATSNAMAAATAAGMAGDDIAALLAAVSSPSTGSASSYAPASAALPAVASSSSALHQGGTVPSSRSADILGSDLEGSLNLDALLQQLSE